MAERILKDVVIIGGGPAGLTAAIYAQRAMLQSVVLEKEAFGGQVVLTSEIDNYPGVPHTDGFTLSDAMKKQAEDLGATVTTALVERIDKTPSNTFEVHTADSIYVTPVVIHAGGASPRHAGFTGEDTFGGRGVSYCATCDGMFYRGKKVFVVGGGNSAAEEALFLSKIASEVVLVVRKDHLRAQALVQKQVEDAPNVTVRYNTKIQALEGSNLPSKIILEDTSTGATTTETYDEGSFGVFVFVGRVPQTELIKDFVDVDEQGYVTTTAKLETKTPGLFVAGDLVQKPLRQIVTAAADGAIAATAAAAYLGQPVEG